MKIVIVGAGNVGRTLVNMLTSEKHNVSIIESNEETSKQAAKQTDALVIHGDGTDMSVLKDAGIEKADAILAVTHDDKVNLMACEIAKSMDVRRIIARVNNSENEQLFTKLGISSIVPVVDMTVTAVDNLLRRDDVKLIAELDKGNVEVIQEKLEETSKLIGRQATIKNAIVGAVYRNGQLILPDSQTVFEKGDVLIIITKSEDAKAVESLISGKKSEKDKAEEKE